MLKAENVSKSLQRKKILSDICLELHAGRVYGITGRNGSGKTMLFRALSGLMRIDSGRISWGERVLHRDFSVLPGLGIVLENAGLYPELTGRKNLEQLAMLHKKAGPAEIEDAILRVGLDPTDKRPYRKYSLGMKQRIVIAQAIMEKPDIIMLDEPTNALDESGVEEIRKIILEEKRRGALILLASHNKTDISLLADEVYQMNNGCLRKEGEDA